MTEVEEFTLTADEQFAVAWRAEAAEWLGRRAIIATHESIIDETVTRLGLDRDNVVRESEVIAWILSQAARSLKAEIEMVKTGTYPKDDGE